MSNIEKDIKNIEQYINLVLDKGYCDCNELNVISTGKYCDGSKNVAYSMQNILAERKQDKARIKELEEQVKNEIKGRDILAKLNEDSIPKQKVKDVLTEIQKEYEKLDKASDDFLNNKEKTVEDYVLEKERLATI